MKEVNAKPYYLATGTGQEWKITINIAQQMGNNLVNAGNFILFSTLFGPMNIITSHSSYLPLVQGNICNGKKYNEKSWTTNGLHTCSLLLQDSLQKQGKIPASETKAFLYISKQTAKMVPETVKKGRAQIVLLVLKNNKSKMKQTKQTNKKI